jgi:methyl-accepting chemotaxis protein
MSSKPYKRRNYFIKQNLQGRYILGYFLLALGAVFFFSLIFFLLSSNTMTISYEDHTLRLGRTPFMLIKQFLTANWLFLLLGSGVLVAAAMLLTHRIAGPIYKFEKYLDEMLAGHLGAPLYLRTHDEGKELGEKLAAVSRRMAETWSELDTLVREQEVLATTEPGSPNAERMAEQNRRFRQILDRFRVAP